MGAADLDFEKQDDKYDQAASEQFAIGDDLTDSVHLQIKLPGNSPGVALVMVGIEFYEQSGGKLIRLQQAALKIVHASKT